MKIPSIKVSNMVSNRGNLIANQFEIETAEGTFFQSYETIIAFISRNGKVVMNKDYTQSVTTGKYRNIFLGETLAETRAKVESGEYEIADLNA